MSWRSEAACKGKPTQMFFPEGPGNYSGAYKKARAVCDGCPVRERCLEDGLVMERTAAQNRSAATYGFFGGMSPSERRPLHKAWREEQKAAA